VRARGQRRSNDRPTVCGILPIQQNDQPQMAVASIGIRPECVQTRRRARGPPAKETNPWWSFELANRVDGARGLRIAPETPCLRAKLHDFLRLGVCLPTLGDGDAIDRAQLPVLPYRCMRSVCQWKKRQFYR